MAGQPSCIWTGPCSGSCGMNTWLHVFDASGFKLQTGHQKYCVLGACSLCRSVSLSSCVYFRSYSFSILPISSHATIQRFKGDSFSEMPMIPASPFTIAFCCLCTWLCAKQKKNWVILRVTTNSPGLMCSVAFDMRSMPCFTMGKEWVGLLSRNSGNSPVIAGERETKILAKCADHDIFSMLAVVASSLRQTAETLSNQTLFAMSACMRMSLGIMGLVTGGGGVFSFGKIHGVTKV